MIEVVDYDPGWVRRFEQLRAEYADAMAAAGVPVVAIEHVGSTAVPGLAVRDLLRADDALREEYGAVKKRVGATARDIYEYGTGKSATVQKMLATAGLSHDERASIADNQIPTSGR